MATDGLRLPVEFLFAVAADAEPESAAATMAAEQVHGMAEADDRQYGQLLEALLRKPHREKAPAWLLETAVTNGLRQATESEYLLGTTTELMALALAHPECDESMRADALLRCPDSLLGPLGTAGRPAALADAVAAELRRRVPQRCRMTPDLIKEPTPAQLVLRTERLHDDVFDAAVALLPDAPDRTRLEDEAFDSWSDRIKTTFGAWERMWRVVLERHPDRHAQLVETVVGTAANRVIRDQLLGSLPWMVEPGLLRRIALDDLPVRHGHARDAGLPLSPGRGVEGRGPTALRHRARRSRRHRPGGMSRCTWRTTYSKPSGAPTPQPSGYATQQTGHGASCSTPPRPSPRTAIPTPG
ncbi:hypothetical protein ACGF12_24875 [Kitasatospora sp. NPDC048296]|uniref:hypothetical protein n=1 Tax=Kitasatospora sp. NPDC048296 TaxID=3364048 RepID=UPI003724858B